MRDQRGPLLFARTGYVRMWLYGRLRPDPKRPEKGGAMSTCSSKY